MIKTATTGMPVELGEMAEIYEAVMNGRGYYQVLVRGLCPKQEASSIVNLEL